ncbi:hypothetical protein ABZS66_19270 [Dactylosporangium sp. NPDC005572]|uniref:hypothetical protein n=1 Tax=Dactylosporangium sp. NPDC005572 TaxID=3156889 RepID=UPI0033B17942
MSLTIPLTVRLVTSRADRHVTSEVRDLTIRSVVPGGFASIQISLARPLILQPDEIAYYGRCIVYDARNRSVVCEGRLEDPGRGAGDDGQIWRLVALGPSAHASDRTVPLILVDDDMSRWTAVEVAACPDGQARVGDDMTIFPGEPSMTLQMPNGTPVTNVSYIGRAYLPIARAGQRVARFDWKWDAGRTTSDLRLRAFARDTPTWASTFAMIRNEAGNTAGGGLSPRVIGTDWTAGKDAVDVRLAWTGATTSVGDDVTWGAWAGMVVQATRYNKSGVELLTGASYPNNTILASDAVEDALGRLLPGYDGPNARIDATTYPIQRLAYPDGISAAEMFADLMQLEQDFYWAAWEANAAGKHRFEWRQWPTVVRYEADVVDGFDSPGSADGLYNGVMVRYRDAAGEIRSVRRTQTVPELDAAGIVRDGPVDLGDDLGSAADATQVGDQWLAQHRQPPNAGTLTVARRVLDMVSGRMVEPWEIRPGELIRVRGVLPRVDALNATARDGVTVFRIVETTYQASTAAATLSLDSYPVTVPRQIAQLQGRRITRRR